jgi:hypothetical protein
MKIVQIAKTILDAARIREESYDEERFEEENEKAIAKSKKENPEGYYGIHFGVDSSNYYRKTLEESIIEACVDNNIPEDMSRLIDLALDSWWNDSLAWAEDILKKEFLTLIIN